MFLPGFVLPDVAFGVEGIKNITYSAVSNYRVRSYLNESDFGCHNDTSWKNGFDDTTNRGLACHGKGNLV
jgi:hypothetical protein